MTLGATAGPTTLFSANLPVYLDGGPTNEVDWQTTLLPGVDLASYELALSAATLSVLVITPTPLAGDFNGDGVVDAADYTVWRDNLGSDEESSLNFAGVSDGMVNAADYQVWKTNFGAGRLSC